ncbi:hypothetical protein [Mesorhizobium huakuii]|uniref:BtrH N-terminal domain-containing protein n=1 Tax=Mesorhizobium huakuii TaxID=28104 RepID=A0A7G6T514_9HYPH|nr:hypothetical protein [Mesorhizobium huakuii]QND61846.1 BtrH N-terminal domain-containing protein [Mesorhizobium huakuii]QND69060.1 BtrH N-terminal domain-containing protein [Mesorhizobium loti]
MSDSIAPILVPSPLANLQTILDALLGVPSEFMLASVWSFNRFDPDAASIAEFDVPGGWDLLGARVAAYAGLELVAAESDPTELAYLRLELGQPVVLAVDSHELPYRPAYGRVHSARTILATRIDRSAGTVDVLDPWPPTYTGSIPISMLDRARQSDVPEDRVREPLYAGVELKRRWWTLALAADARSRTVDGAMTAIAELAHEAETTASADAIERFRVIVAEAMSKGDGAWQVRRAAALHLRAEVGLRAYLLALLRRTAQLLGDTLFAAEVDRWATHLDALGFARDVLIKSLGFDRSEYAVILARALCEASGRERRFVQFLRAFCLLDHTDELTKGQA